MLRFTRLSAPALPSSHARAAALGSDWAEGWPLIRRTAKTGMSFFMEGF
jgi:hypothetical protein